MDPVTICSSGGGWITEEQRNRGTDIVNVGQDILSFSIQDSYALLALQLQMGHSDAETEPGAMITAGSFLKPQKEEVKRGIFKGFGLSTIKSNNPNADFIANLKSVLDRAALAHLYDEGVVTGPLSRYRKHQPLKSRVLILQNISYSGAEQRQDIISSNKNPSYLWVVAKTDAFQDCMCTRLVKNLAINRLGKLSIYQETENGGCPYCQLLLDVINAYKPGWTRPSVSTTGLQRHGPGDIERKTILVELGPQGIARVFLTSRGWQGQLEFFIQPSIPKYFVVNSTMRLADYDLSKLGYLRLASIWLQDCIKMHRNCEISDSKFMPTRLIDVGLDNSEPSLREGDLCRASYVALSYCWGSVENTLRTTKENITSHRQSIPYSTLPQTLKDAVTVCRRMNVRYLWVDALCIIQDDLNEKDWYTESGKMRHIYANALFAIAADASTNCDEGFLRAEYDSPRWHTFSRTQEGSKTQVVAFRTSKDFKHGDDYALTTSALSKRGWALQESILPNRILHFTEDEIVWECNTHCQCQCGQSSYALVKLTCQGISKSRNLQSNAIPTFDDDEHDRSRDIVDFLSSHTHDSVYWAWQTIVEHYTQRQLTNLADKLTALSGLAQVAIESHGFRGGDYLAGLWRGGLVKGLLWHVRGPLQPRRYLQYQAPSWSWASICGGVKYFSEHFQFQFEEDINILDAVCDASPLDPTGRVQSGFIICTGRLTAVQLSVREVIDLHDSSMYIGYNGHAGHTHKDQISFVSRDDKKRDYEVLLDEHTDCKQYTDGYLCLRIGTTVDPRADRARIWWLVLKQHGHLESEPYVMERVGIGYTHTRHTLTCDLFSGAKERTIKLL